MIIDDTPSIVTISSFDPVRRQIAVVALEALIKDSRIQPAKIEKEVSKAQKEIKDALSSLDSNLAKSLNGDDVNIEDCIYKGKKKYYKEIKIN